MSFLLKCLIQFLCQKYFLRQKLIRILLMKVNTFNINHTYTDV